MEKDLSRMSLEELWELFPVTIEPYRDVYEIQYAEEKESLCILLGRSHIARISHIGSTAVKTIDSKPIVDILLELWEASSLEKIKKSLIHSGWLLMKDRKTSASFNKGYTPAGYDDSVFHLHVRIIGDWDELYFRDYLIAHPDVALSYENLKRKLAVKYQYNRDAYTEAKTDFITYYTAQARMEFGSRYQPKPR